MTNNSPAAARYSALARHRKPGDPDLLDARRDLAEQQLADAIRAAARTAPPLSDAQRARLATLILASDTP